MVASCGGSELRYKACCVSFTAETTFKMIGSGTGSTGSNASVSIDTKANGVMVGFMSDIGASTITANDTEVFRDVTEYPHLFVAYGLNATDKTDAVDWTLTGGSYTWGEHAASFYSA